MVTNSLGNREIIEKLRMLDSDVLLGNSLWNESVKVEDHANGTLIIHSMKVEVDTIQEVEVEPHRIFIHEFNDNVVILMDNCMTEATQIISGVKW